MTEPEDPSSQVGYKKPPAEHRFKKGASGNPAGRPKKALVVRRRADSEFADAFLAEMDRDIPLVVGDEIHMVPAFRALVRRVTADALKGDRAAQRMIFRNRLAAEAIATREKKDVMENIRQYRGGWKRGRLPHYEHLVIDPVGMLRIVGPITKEESVEWEALKSDIKMFVDLIEKRRASGDHGSAASIEKYRDMLLDRVPEGWDWQEKLSSSPPEMW